MNKAIFAPDDALLRNFEQNAQNFRWSGFVGSSAAALNKTELNGGERDERRHYATIYHRLHWDKTVVTSQ